MNGKFIVNYGRDNALYSPNLFPVPPGDKDAFSSFLSNQWNYVTEFWTIESRSAMMNPISIPIQFKLLDSPAYFLCSLASQMQKIQRRVLRLSGTVEALDSRKPSSCILGQSDPPSPPNKVGSLCGRRSNGSSVRD